MEEILSGTKFSAQGGPASGWKCAFCGGRGIQPRSLSSKCIACRGKGEVSLEYPAIKCPSCKGTGRASNFPMLSCLKCKGIGVVEKAGGKDSSGNIIGERLGEITKRLQWVQKETEGKKEEIGKKLEPIKPFIKEIKEKNVWLKKLGNKIKKAWKFLCKK